MTCQDDMPDLAADLYKKAEKLSKMNDPHDFDKWESLSPEKINQMFHELRVHQIELEIQNEELRRAQIELDATRARYFDLYDLAPVGYCTLSDRNLILEANLTASSLLGSARKSMVNQPFTRFIHKEDQDIYYHTRKHAIATTQRQACELRMIKTDGFVFWSRLEVTSTQNEDNLTEIRVVLSDITNQKQVEEALREVRESLEMRVAERTTELAAASEAERQQRQFSEALGAAALLLNQSLEQRVVLETILSEVEQVIPYQAAIVDLLDGDSYYRASMHGARSPHSALETHERYPLAQSPLLLKMTLSNQPLLVPETRQEPDWVLRPEFKWSRSVLSAPLIINGRVIGFISLFSDTPGFFKAEMQDHLVAFSAHAAAAIHNAELFEQVQTGNVRLQSLSRHLVVIQESERHYIARELHDEAGQMLSFLILDLATLDKKVDQPDTVLAKINEIKDRLKEVMENLHRVAMALRPASLDHLGLVPALRTHVESVGERHPIKVSFKAHDQVVRLVPEVETTVYRIAQEALTNIIRHARATRIDVLLTVRDDKLIMIVEDDGVGFQPGQDQVKKRLGLVGMKERAEMIGGKLLIESEPGYGTTIMLEVDYRSVPPKKSE